MTASRTYRARMGDTQFDCRAWTEHDDARLFDLVAEGLSSAVIGERMGRSKSSIIGRVHRRGLKFAIAPIGGPKRLRKHPEAPRAAPKPKASPPVHPRPAPEPLPLAAHLPEPPLRPAAFHVTAMRERAEVIVKRGRPAR